MQDLYQQGWLSEDAFKGYTPNPPQWAIALRFSAEGCYVYASQDDLMRACPSLVRLKAYDQPAYLELLPQPRNMQGFQEYFKQLELMDVNLLSACSALTLTCYGGSLSQTKQGKTVLNGRYNVSGKLGVEQVLVELNIRGSMVLSQKPDTHGTVSVQGVVAYFSVPCALTMDPTDFSEHWAAYSHVDNPLFGFFEKPPTKEETQPPSKRSSFLKFWKKGEEGGSSLH